MGQLAALEFLFLDGNQLETVPPEMCQLINLHTLRLDSNRISTLPPEMGQLAALWDLYLRGNQLETVPPEMCQLARLCALYLDNNRISTLPREMGQLVGLSSLFLNRNQLQTLPLEIFQLPRLRNLDLERNQLQTLPPEMSQLAELRELRLYDNQLQTLPNSLVDLSAQCTINLEVNPLPLTVIEQLDRAIAQRRHTDPTRGPRLEYSMPANPTPLEQERPLLSAEVAAWRREGGRPYTPEERANWEAITNGATLDQDSAQALSNLLGLSNFLGSLRSTAHYRLAPEDLQTRVNTLLDQLHQSPEALQSCAAQAVEGTSACHDRIALAFFLMEESLIVRDALDLSQTPSMQSTPEQLQAIARGLYKSEVLRAVANQKIDDLKARGGSIDDTEIILKYWVKRKRPANPSLQWV